MSFDHTGRPTRSEDGGGGGRYIETRVVYNIGIRRLLGSADYKCVYYIIIVVIIIIR